MNTTVTFELTTPIHYAMGTGDDIECNHIDLLEPSGKVSDICCQIESLIQSGLLSMADVLGKDIIAEATEAANEKKDSKKPKEEKGPDVESIIAIMSSGGVDMGKVVLHFRELFKQVAMMGGEKLITMPRIYEMSHKDFKQMMGVYAANFILN